jgi:hypothetical protein
LPETVKQKRQIAGQSAARELSRAFPVSIEPISDYSDDGYHRSAVSLISIAAQNEFTADSGADAQAANLVHQYLPGGGREFSGH